MIKDVHEDIEVGVDAVTIDIQLHVCLCCTENTSTEFVMSIDSTGCLVLTPESTDAEFLSATIIQPQDEIVADTCVTDDNGCITKSETINIRATMLSESNNLDVTTSIDEIGQCIITPVAEDTLFIDATIGDSLNLVTDENDEDYNLLSDLTEDFTESQGQLLCETEEDCNTCVDILSEYYDTVSTQFNNSGYIVSYKKEKLNENLDESKRLDVINRFMSGDMYIIYDDRPPLPSYYHMYELDADNYSYYYDPESDCMLCYVREYS